MPAAGAPAGHILGAGVGPGAKTRGLCPPQGRSDQHIRPRQQGGPAGGPGRNERERSSRTGRGDGGPVRSRGSGCSTSRGAGLGHSPDLTGGGGHGEEAKEAAQACAPT